jgi:hypothetical protein
MNQILKIGFPRSTEDHRLQLVDVNGSVFAIVHSALESNGPIRLNCEEWSLVLLAPIKSQANIFITAINVIRLNTVESSEGIGNMSASNQLVGFAPPLKQVAFETGLKGERQFIDDPAGLLTYSQLFRKVVKDSHTDNLPEAQKHFMMCLCAIANKIEPNGEDLNLQRVFGIWDIPWQSA